MNVLGRFLSFYNAPLQQFHLTDLLLFFNDNALNELFINNIILKYTLQIYKNIINYT